MVLALLTVAVTALVRAGSSSAKVDLELKPAVVTGDLNQVGSQTLHLETNSVEMVGFRAKIAYPTEFLQLVDQNGDPAQTTSALETFTDTLDITFKNEYTPGLIDYQAVALLKAIPTQPFDAAKLRFKFVKCVDDISKLPSVIFTGDTAVTGPAPVSANVLGQTIAGKIGCVTEGPPGVDLELNPAEVTGALNQVGSQTLHLETNSIEMVGFRAKIAYPIEFLQLVDQNGDPAQTTSALEAFTDTLDITFKNEYTPGLIDYQAVALLKANPTQPFDAAKLRFEFVKCVDDISKLPSVIFTGPAPVSANVLGKAIGGKIGCVTGGITPVTASFTFNPTTGLEGSAVTFDGSGSSAGATNIVEYAWDFCDNTSVLTGSSATVTHTYADEGTGSYTVALTVTDDNSGTGTTSKAVPVSNVAPNITSVAATPSSPGTGETVTLIASFTDPGSTDTHTATIDWGDNTGTQTGTVGQSTKTITGTHSYPNTGSYTVTVVVTDNDGTSDTDSTLTIGVISVGAENKWDATLTFTVAQSDVTLNAGISTLKFGVDPNTTPGFDDGPDEPISPPPQTPYILFYFHYPSNATGSQKLFTSRIAPAQTTRDVLMWPISVGKPKAPTNLSPNKVVVTDLSPTATWKGANPQFEKYQVDLPVDNFANVVATATTSTDIESHQFTSLQGAKLYQWRVRGINIKSNQNGPFSTAEFITTGAAAQPLLTVKLEGTGDISGAAGWVVKLYDKSAFTAAIANAPWNLFNSTALFTFTGSNITVANVDTTTRTYTLGIPGVPLGFYDVTIEASHTLVNLRDDTGLTSGTTNMGTLLEGDAIADARPGVEPGGIINALDASLIAAAIFTGSNDLRVDFDRDGDADTNDFDLLKKNYLKFSPWIVKD